jgi:hypothetical protein
VRTEKAPVTSGRDTEYTIEIVSTLIISVQGGCDEVVDLLDAFFGALEVATFFAGAITIEFTKFAGICSVIKHRCCLKCQEQN